MTTRTLLAAGYAAALSLNPWTVASAQEPPPLSVATGTAGQCRFAAISANLGFWPFDTSWVAVVSAGPVAADVAGSISLTCAIQVGAANSTHHGADAAAVTSPTLVQVAAIPPTDGFSAPVVEFEKPEGQPVYICTHAVVSGLSYYWDAATGDWSTEAGVACGEPAVEQEITPGPFAPVTGVVDDAVRTHVNGTACPILQGPFPPDGEVLGVWDCPPYD